MDWISVKDRLPELKHGSLDRDQCEKDSDDVLICYGGHREITIARLNQEFAEGIPVWRIGIEPISLVTHWMPLPERPSSRAVIDCLRWLEQRA